MEPTTINKSEIITLIVADIRSRKLIMGLEAAGLATDDFNTNLFALIFSKMHFPNPCYVEIGNWYEDTVYDLLDMDLNKFRMYQVFLAEKLYDALEEKYTQVPGHQLLKKERKFTFLKWNWFRRFDN